MYTYTPICFLIILPAFLSSLIYNKKGNERSQCVKCFTRVTSFTSFDLPLPLCKVIATPS